MIARLVLANLLELLAGVGVAMALGVPLGVGYLAGVGVVGIVSAHLALLGVSYGWVALAVTAGVSLAIGLCRRGLDGVMRVPRPTAWAVAGSVVLAGLFVRAWPTFAAKPLNDYDGWAEWGMKGKALTLFGWADPHLFAAKEAWPLNLDYPLLLPSLEAVASRAMGGFDSRLIHLQFLLFAVAGFAALYALSRDRVAGWLLWPLLVALAVAPAMSMQLLTAYADVPLAFFVAAGVVAAARWLDDQRPQTLALATLFFAAAALTKKEGAIFVAAGYLALLLATRRWRPILISALVVEVLLLPWQIWLHANHVHKATSYSWQFLHHPGIGPLIVQALLGKMFSFHAWLLLLPIFCIAVIAAAGTRLAVFATTWVLISTCGITTIYLTSSLEWSSYFAFSGTRVIDSVVIGAAALTPLLAAEATVEATCPSMPEPP